MRASAWPPDAQSSSSCRRHGEGRRGTGTRLLWWRRRSPLERTEQSRGEEMDKIHGLELGRLEVRKTCSLFMRRPRGDLEAGAVVGRELLEAPLAFRIGSECD